MLAPRDVVLARRLGSGAFGDVLQGTCFGQPVAIKTVPKYGRFRALYFEVQPP